MAEQLATVEQSDLRPFFKQFSQLAIANVVSNLMVPLASLIDTAFLGHLADIHYLAGVALATVIFNIVYWSFGFLRMGTTGLTAQAFGRRDFQGVLRVLLRNSLLAIGLGGCVLALQVPIRIIGFSVLSAETAVRTAGEAFYSARIWGAPAVFLNYVLMGWLLGQGRAKPVILLSLVGNGGNIVLDYWFIRQLGWASAGAGAATALSQAMMVVVGIGFVIRAHPLSTLWELHADLWDKEQLQTIFRLNRNILIRAFAVISTFALFTNWSSALGTGILAANTLLLQVVTLTSYFCDGIAFATESFAGQFYGVGNRAGLQALLKLGGGTSVLMGLLFAMIFALFPEPLFRLMTQHEEVVATVGHYVWWLVPTLGAGAIAYLLDGYFLGITAGEALRNATLTATLLGFLPLGTLAYLLAAPHLLWLAFALFMGCRAVTLAWRVPQTLAVTPLMPPPVLSVGEAASSPGSPPQSPP